MEVIFIMLVGIALAIFLIVASFRSSKSPVKIFSLIYILFIIALLVFSGILLKDALELRDGLTNETNLFLLKNSQSGELLAALALDPSMNGSNLTQQPIFFSQDNFSKLKQTYESEGPQALSGGYYKVLVFDSELFTPVKSESVDAGSFNLSVSESLAILYSDQPKEDFIALAAQKQGLNKSHITLPDDYYVRSSLFSLCQSALFEGGGTNEVIRGLNNGMVQVYPSSLTFKVIELLPQSIVDGLTDSVSSEE